MGVPSFYRWLVNRYPKVVVNAREETGDGVVDSSMPNPNGIEFDNLYLDMNGIIHPCFHPEDQPFPPTTFDEVFMAIFEYIDRIFRIVRPRKLLYMAIDGVAPRAKMNQQRARRFRTAKDAEIADAEEERLRSEFEKEGRNVLRKQENEVSDSNVITPGTIFMQKLSKALEYYIRLRLNTDPGWKNMKVILSDANVPGEGEHKIMSFVRLQRNHPGYNPNTRHCLYGLDADLIMLALATHEIHFSIIRENVIPQSQEYSMSSLETNLSKGELELVKSRSWFGKIVKASGESSAKKPYQFLNVWTLREYLELDLMISEPPFVIDFERIVDDFIFMCFFLGNDFLPHLPSLQLHEMAIDLLMTVYKQLFKKMGGYLVDTARIKDKKAAYIKEKRVESFIQAVGSYENKIFEKRYNIQQKRLKRLLCEKFESMGQDDSDYLENTMCNDSMVRHQINFSQLRDSREMVSTSRTSKTEAASVYKKGACALQSVLSGDDNESDILNNTKELMQQVKKFLRDKQDLVKHGCFENDKIKWGIPNWRARYYKEKFTAGSPEDIEKVRKKLVGKYAEGLCWVLQYYFAGVCSWTWYYPFYYGPFASDIKSISFSTIKFDLGCPFKPFDQLMAVLPPRSMHALPQAYGHLMTSEDSRILVFYPNDFEVDTDGKRYLWQGVVKLPFINEDLIKETRIMESKLKEDEIKRNLNLNSDTFFVMKSHRLAVEHNLLYHCHMLKAGMGRKENSTRIDSTISDGMNGFLCLDNVEQSIFSSPAKGMEKIVEDHVISAGYKNPTFHDHVPKLLENVHTPERTITEADIPETQLWHEKAGSQPHMNSSSWGATQQRASGNRLEFNSPASLDRVGWKSAGWLGRGRGRCHSEGSSSRSFHGPNSKIDIRGEGPMNLTHPGVDSSTFRVLDAVNGGSLRQQKGFKCWNGGRGDGYTRSRDGSGTYLGSRTSDPYFTPSSDGPADRGRGRPRN